MKVLSLFAALLAVSTVQASRFYNPSSSGLSLMSSAVASMHDSSLTKDRLPLPKCFPHCP